MRSSDFVGVAVFDPLWFPLLRELLFFLDADFDIFSADTIIEYGKRLRIATDLDTDLRRLPHVRITR